MPLNSTENAFTELLTKLKNDCPSFQVFLNAIEGCHEGEFFIAGGSVRDHILRNNKQAKDIDIFVTLAGHKKISKFLETNGKVKRNQFGNYRWFPFNEENFYYDIIVISNFYNGLWVCRDIVDVLNQFDITANAIAFDLISGELFDPVNGIKDLQEGLLKAVRFDYPDLPISEDESLSRNSVLYFRYISYAIKLDLIIEPLTARWIQENGFRMADLERFSELFFRPDLA